MRARIEDQMIRAAFLPKEQMSGSAGLAMQFFLPLPLLLSHPENIQMLPLTLSQMVGGMQIKFCDISPSCTHAVRLRTRAPDVLVCVCLLSFFESQIRPSSA